MNEQLRQLMVQADYPAPELALRAHKLAELIVKDCCDTLYSYGYDDAREQIIRHFGVKDD
jgi:hypothetical protein